MKQNFGNTICYITTENKKEKEAILVFGAFEFYNNFWSLTYKIFIFCLQIIVTHTTQEQLIKILKIN